ncbi:MAG: ATP-binding protein [Betaproteobacteria bacterium]
MAGTPGFSLFWRTLLLLVMLLAGAVFAWVQTLRAMEFEPRAVQEAQQIARLVNLAGAALSHGDAGRRAALVQAMDRPPVRLLPRKPGDRLEPYEVDRFSRRVGTELRAALDPDAELASSVDGQPGPWVGFAVGTDRYWLQAASGPEPQPAFASWASWIGLALLATLLGSVAVARLINRPLKQLSFAASRIRGGDLESQLDENTPTIEIREVNRGFNRMARELARVEEDRAVMLAGISHDLRTPLARLRLETEMSVADEEARRNMALDIDQLDAIIDKFMDYARPGDTELQVVHVTTLVERAMAGFRDASQIRIATRVPRDLYVMADETELGRVFLNLFENARRYGRGTDTGMAEVQVSAQLAGTWVILSVRDHGPGVAPAKLSQLTTPFFRGDAARTAATGAGLGLAIVDKAMQRMGGTLELALAPEGGLVAHLRLQRATPNGVQSARLRSR